MIFVGIGAFWGAMARFSISNLITSKGAFPLGTFIVNLFGCFLIGCLYPFHIAEHWHLLLAIGFLGAFTTFSTFSIEVLKLMQQENYKITIIYIVGSVVLGLFCTYLGLTIFQFII